MHQIIKNYRDDEYLRHSFNELAKKTFGIDFEALRALKMMFPLLAHA